MTLGKGILWLVLALPSVPMTIGYAGGSADAESLLHPTGEFAARWMIIAMLISPLRLMFPDTRWLKWMGVHRRAFGVAAFVYALVHLLLYVVDMGSLQLMLDEFFALGIWTGWAAFAIFIPLAITSNEQSLRALGARWKRLHRWVYPAAVLTLVHWMFVHNNFGPALVHFVPLGLLEIYRITRVRREKT